MARSLQTGFALVKLLPGKEVAADLGISQRTLRRICELLGIEPDIPGCSHHRYSASTVKRIVRVWRQLRKNSERFKGLPRLPKTLRPRSD